MFGSIGPEEAQAAQVGIAGGFGAFIHAYIRHIGSLLRFTGGILIGIGCAITFAENVAPLVKLIPVIGSYIEKPLIPTAVVIGLTAKVIAEKLLRSVERFDLFSYFKRRKTDD